MMSSRCAASVFLSLICLGSGSEVSTGASTAFMAAQHRGPAPPAAAPPEEVQEQHSAHSAHAEQAEEPATNSSTPKLVPPGEVFGALKDAVMVQLSNRKGQWADALVALVFGSMMVTDGDTHFKYFISTTVFIFVASLTSQSLHVSFPHMVDYVRFTLAAEAGLAIAYSAAVGYEAVKIVIALCVGGAVAFYMFEFLKSHEFSSVTENPGFEIFLPNLCILLGGFIVFGKPRGKYTPLSVVSCWVGGGLVSSALGYFVMLLAVTQKVALLKAMPAAEALQIPEECPMWIQFFKMMVVPTAEMIGVFSKDPAYNKEVEMFGSKKHFHLDYVLGLTCWAFFFFIGIWRQARVRKAKTAAEDAAKDIKGKKEPLLGKK